MYLQWAKCLGEWCSLYDLNPADVEPHGVYVIWKPNGDVLRPSAVVRVGFGDLAARIAADRTDPEIRIHGERLLVSWAAADPARAAGAAAYLTRLLRPLVGGNLPADLRPVPVNIPISA